MVKVQGGRVFIISTIHTPSHFLYPRNLFTAPLNVVQTILPDSYTTLQTPGFPFTTLRVKRTFKYPHVAHFLVG